MSVLDTRPPAIDELDVMMPPVPARLVVGAMMDRSANERS
jgi:hypothetical protein